MSSDALQDLVDLKDLTREETRAALVALGEPRFRGDQVFRQVHARGAADALTMTDLPRSLRERLAERAVIPALDIATMQVSVDGTRKMTLRTRDGRLIESVLIPDGDASSGERDEAEDADVLDEDGAAERADDHDGGRFGASEFDGGRARDDVPAGLSPRRPKLTQCVSSQVGCALDCTFCATATLGFGRNLGAGEIVDQIYRARALLALLPADDPTRRAGAARVTNLVFMGMGEPLHNLKELLRALGILTDPQGAAISPRRITVSTAGLVPGLARLGEAPFHVNLAISLNATTDAVRDELMPINRKWNLAALLGAIRAFPLERRRRVTFEYVLLDGVNDSLADARRLPELLRGIPSKVNLIPWNAHPASPFSRPPDARIAAFQAELKARGLAAYVRRSRGRDIDAACGQLAANGAPARAQAPVKAPVKAEPLVALRV